jgi:PncC family amidohydrolase
MGEAVGMNPEEKLNRLLAERQLTIALAESCTGGLISSRITDVAGSSNHFESGLVTYSNEAKEGFLHVPHDLIKTKGAVSAEVAEKMAQGVREVTDADIGLSVTGIAGPGGGSCEKPVGTVYMGLAVSGKSFVRKHKFSGDRLTIKKLTADEALKFAIDYLEGRVE